MRPMTQLRVGPAALVVLACFALACGGHSTGPQDPPKGLASCVGNDFLTVAPIDPALLREIVPLGSLNPPAHTLPTDHLYLNTTIVSRVSTVANVVAPGNIVLTEVTRSTRTAAGTAEAVDYGISFFPCADVFMYFAHVALSVELSAKVGAFTTCDPPYSTGGTTATNCRKPLEITLTPGALIGTVGGPTNPGLDYGGNDRRVPALAFINQARSPGSDRTFGQKNTICPVDYYVAAVATVLRTKLGRNGVTRTIAPVCGTIMQDLPNTAQGRWFFNSTTQDDPHLALAHDNGDPRLGVISGGTSMPSLPSGARTFTPSVSGRVNTDFPLVTADNQIYCYQSFLGNPAPPLRHVLIQLTTSARVRIEGFIGATCGDASTWAFTSGATEFSR